MIKERQIEGYELAERFIQEPNKLQAAEHSVISDTHSRGAKTAKWMPVTISTQYTSHAVQHREQISSNISHRNSLDMETQTKMKCSQQVKSMSSTHSKASCRQRWLSKLHLRLSILDLTQQGQLHAMLALKAASTAVHHRPPCAAQETWCLVTRVSDYWASVSASYWYDHSSAECSPFLKTAHHTCLSTTNDNYYYNCTPATRLSAGQYSV